MTRSTQAILWALLSIGAGTSSAHAFSDPERFAAPSDEGGGGGRFFTGSPADGYTCAVCHSGGTPAQVAVLGLPASGFGPSQIVEAELSFVSPGGNHAVALEVVDAWGRDLGLELLGETEIPLTERCGGVQGGRRASYITQQGDRRILGVEACEARAVRFRFRTPPADRAIFVATVLASDNSASVDGDGVTEIMHTLYPDGQSHQAAASAGCSVMPGSGRTHRGCGLLSLGVFLGLARVRRRVGRRLGHVHP